MASTIVLKHDTFGWLTGVVTSQGPLQFRNLPYSNRPSRWQHSTPLERLPNNSSSNPYDATQWGPMAPQDTNSIAFDFGLIQKELPLDRTLKSSEEDCLNLVVTTPSLEAKAADSSSDATHGRNMVSAPESLTTPLNEGQFMFTNLLIDLCRLVKYSQEIRKPVVGVGINYRLGLLGFLAPTALDDSERAGNYGLGDQVSALKWIQQHIVGFGGDPKNVTVFGESAGSISTYLHVLRGEPLFQRAICMSGDPRLRNPQPVVSQEREFFQPLLQSLGLSELSVAEQAARLRSLPWEELVKSEFNMRVFPSISNGFVRLEYALEEHKRQASKHFGWCKSFMIGDCAQDASAFFRVPSKSDWLNTFRLAAGEYLSSEEVELLIDAYKLGTGIKANGHIEIGLAQLTSDVRFYLPLVLASLAVPEGADLRTYHILESNPFDGPFKGFATHVLDIALIFQNYEEYLPAETAALAKRMAQHFLDFANSEVELRVGGGTDRLVTVWGPAGKVRKMSAAEYDATERQGAAELVKKIGVDKCTRTLELFQFRRSS